MADDTFNGSAPQEAADEIFGVINVVSGVAYNSDAKTLSGVVDNLADDKYLKVGWNGFYTEGIKCDIDSAETRAIASAKDYTDTAIASITGLSIEGLSGASGVAYDSANKVISGRVDNIANEGGYLKVNAGGFYVSGINKAIEDAKLAAISASTGAIGAKNGVRVTEQDGVKTVEGVVDGGQPEKFLKVGSNGFYVSGVTDAIGAARDEAVSTAKQYTDDKVREAISGSIDNLSATGGVAFSDNTFSGVVDDSQPEKFLKVGGGGFYTTGISGAIGTAKQEAVSTAKQYTDEKVGQAITGSIANLSATGGVVFNNNTFSGVVAGSQSENFLRVGGDGFYTTGITGAIDAAKQEAITASTAYTYSAITAINENIEAISGEMNSITAGSGVAMSNHTIVGVVDPSSEGGYLTVGKNGFKVSGIKADIAEAIVSGISGIESVLMLRGTVTAGTQARPGTITETDGFKIGYAYIVENNGYIQGEDKEVEAGDMFICTSVNGGTPKWSVIQTNITADDMVDTAVTYSRLTANEHRPILVKRETGAGSGTGDVQFTSGLTVNNTGDLSGHSINVTSGITANNLTTTSITYNGTALTEYIENTVTSITEDHDEKVKQVRYTGTAAKPVIINTNGAENTGAVGFVTAVTVDGNGGLSAVSASINNITSTSITATNLSANNFFATAITYNGQSLNEYISQTADDKNVSQEPITGTATIPIITRKPGVTAGNTSDGVAYASGAVVIFDSRAGATKISANTIDGTSIESGATDLSDLFVGTATTISGTGYLGGGGNLSGNRTITHKELLNATGQTIHTAQTPSFGGTFKIPVITYDKAGHISAVSETTVALPTQEAGSDSAVTQTSFAGTGSAYMVLHAGTGSSTTGVSYVTGVSSDKDGNLKSASVSAGTVSAATDIRGGNVSAGTVTAARSMVTSAMTANTITAGTNSAQTAVTVTGVVKATKFVGIIDCGTYSGS